MSVLRGPQLGQGANVALVDAWKLSLAVQASLQGNGARELVPAEAVADAVQAYTRERRWRMWFYQLNSRFLTPVFQSNSVVIGKARDAFMGPLCQFPPTRRQMVGTMCGALAPTIVNTIPDEEYLGFLDDPYFNSTGTISSPSVG